jgi:glycosyltransferase involved in cell wall biosynthesis
MKINFVSYYNQNDGYGRYSTYLVKALQQAGVTVKTATLGHVDMPRWMQAQEGIDWNSLTISLLPPDLIQSVPGRHWMLTMTEVGKLPKGWAEKINSSNIERLIVPCRHNAEVFRESGVLCPIHVVPGGTSPKDFPLLEREVSRPSPYTFLTLADRGFRKGWEDVWKAFYLAFGGKTTGEMDVRLIIKSRPKGKGNSTVEWMEIAEGGDKRINYFTQDVQDMNRVYSLADCLVLPSYCEGWGMPHREAAMKGLPVITQQFSGLDDGYTQEWSLPVFGEVKPAGKDLGVWQIPDKEELAKLMKWCYTYPDLASNFGKQAAGWLRLNQTWQHSASKLLRMIGGEYGEEESSVHLATAGGDARHRGLANPLYQR